VREKTISVCVCVYAHIYVKVKYIILIRCFFTAFTLNSVMTSVNALFKLPHFQTHLFFLKLIDNMFTGTNNSDM